MRWRARLERMFDDCLGQCPSCGARLRVMGEVTGPDAIVRILTQPALVGGRKRTGPATMAHAHRQCRWSVKSIAFSS